MNRGHESKRHFEAKLEYHFMLEGTEWVSFYEQRCADIVLYHRQTGFIAAIELENTVRNAVRNVRRNMKNGCHAVATIVLDEFYHDQIKNKIRRHICAKHQGRIKVFSNDDQGRTDLLSWLNELAGKHNSPTEEPQ